MTTDHSDILAERHIESAIDQHDNPDAYTAAEIRDAFGTLQQDLADSLETFDDFKTVAYEDKELVIYVGEENDLAEAIDAAGIEADDILESILATCMKAVALTRSDDNWGSNYPIVIRKSLALRRGERHALARISQISRDLGDLSKGADWYACEIRGWGQSKWSEYTGRSRSAAGKNIRESRR